MKKLLLIALVTLSINAVGQTSLPANNPKDSVSTKKGLTPFSFQLTPFNSNSVDLNTDFKLKDLTAQNKVGKDNEKLPFAFPPVIVKNIIKDDLTNVHDLPDGKRKHGTLKQVLVR